MSDWGPLVPQNMVVEATPVRNGVEAVRLGGWEEEGPSESPLNTRSPPHLPREGSYRWGEVWRGRGELAVQRLGRSWGWGGRRNGAPSENPQGGCHVTLPPTTTCVTIAVRRLLHPSARWGRFAVCVRM